MADPAFYAEGTTPRRSDTRLRVLQKILAATRDGGGGGGGGNSTGTVGSGSPEGVVTGSPGDTYLDQDTNSLWYKETGSNTDTGWIQLIA